MLATRPDGRMPEFEARMLFRQLAAGLQTLWSRRLIHRDIKPQNILLSAPWPAAGTLRPDGTVLDPDGGPPTPLPTTLVKLGDFGFARHLAVADMAETLCGSPLYMAPELLRFQRYDARCDLWSAGAVLFQMLAGRPAFRGANPMELLRAIDTAPVAGAPPFPRGVEPSAAALSLIDGLLQRDPDRRITVPQLLLHPFVTGHSSPKRAIRAPVTAAAAADDAAADAAPAPAAAGARRRRSTRSAATAAAAEAPAAAPAATSPPRQAAAGAASPDTLQAAAGGATPTTPAARGARGPRSHAHADTAPLATDTPGGSPAAPGEAPPSSASAAAGQPAGASQRRTTSAPLPALSGVAAGTASPFRVDASLGPAEAMESLLALPAERRTMGVFGPRSSAGGGGGDPPSPPLGAVSLCSFQYGAPGREAQTAAAWGDADSASRRAAAEAGGCLLVTTECDDRAGSAGLGPVDSGSTGSGSDGGQTRFGCFSTAREVAAPAAGRQSRPATAEGGVGRAARTHAGRVSSAAAAAAPVRSPGTPPSSAAHTPLSTGRSPSRLRSHSRSASEEPPLLAALPPSARPAPPRSALLAMAEAVSVVADMLWARALHVPRPIADACSVPAPTPPRAAEAAAPDGAAADDGASSRDATSGRDRLAAAAEALAARVLPVPTPVVPALPRIRPSVLKLYDELAAEASDRAALAAADAFAGCVRLAAAAGAADSPLDETDSEADDGSSDGDELDATSPRSAAQRLERAAAGHEVACRRIAAARQGRQQRLKGSASPSGTAECGAAGVCAHMAAAALRQAGAMSTVLKVAGVQPMTRLGALLSAAALWLDDHRGDRPSLALPANLRQACAAMASAA